MLITKPKHGRAYAFNKLDNARYVEFAERYSYCKRWGFRGVAAFATGTGVYGVVTQVVKGQVIQYGKRRLAVLCIGACTYVCAPALAVITNATKVVNASKAVYTTIGYIGEALEDIGTLWCLPIDLALFGQPIPTGESSRFSQIDKFEDVIKNLPVVGDGDD